MTEPECVTLQVEDGVGTIRLDRPKMNAIDEQLHREVRRAAQEAGKREDVRAVVLYGEAFTRHHAIAFGFIWSAVAIYVVDSLRPSSRR